jgi:uncharacterized protein (DUF1697 family)
MHYRGLQKRPHLHPIRHCRLYRLPRPASYASRSCRPRRPQPLSARTLSRELPVRDTHQTPTALAPEAVTVFGLHLYTDLPNGLGNSKLADSLTRQSTTRNWRTVTKLYEMMATT